jgi:hypothetical protein
MQALAALHPMNRLGDASEVRDSPASQPALVVLGRCPCIRFLRRPRCLDALRADAHGVSHVRPFEVGFYPLGPAQAVPRPVGLFPPVARYPHLMVERP